MDNTYHKGICSGCWNVLTRSHLQGWGQCPSCEVRCVGVSELIARLFSSTIHSWRVTLPGHPHSLRQPSPSDLSLKGYKSLTLLPQVRTVKGHPSSKAFRGIHLVSSSVQSCFVFTLSLVLIPRAPPQSTPAWESVSETISGELNLG